MSLELSTLVFKVDTEQLTEAVRKTKELSDAQKGLATAMSKGGSGSSKPGSASGKNADSLTSALERQATKMKILRGESVSLADGLSKLDRVFTAGQAGQLASLKLGGASIEQYNQLAKSLQDFTKISGANPFDNTASGLAKMKNEVQELHRVNELAAKGFKLTRDEVRLLQRDINSNTQSLKSAGATSEQINKSNLATQASFIKEAKLRNELVVASKEQERQSKIEASAAMESSQQQQKSSEQLFKNRINFINEEIASRGKLRQEFKSFYGEQERQSKQSGASTKAVEQPMDKARALYNKELTTQAKETARVNKALATEMQRVDAVLGEMNSTYGLNVKTQQKSAEQVANYAANLKRAGVEGQRATVLMEDYRKKVSQIADIDKKRAGERLSNALAPQISDVAVSLAGGMPLHLVMMQQGLQVRDLIGNSKIDVKDLDQVFRKSMSNMVTSIGGTVKALSSLAYSGIKDAGLAVSNFALKWSGLGMVLDGVVKKFPAAAGGISFAASALGVLTGGLLAGAIVGIGALAYQYVKLIQANDELARSLAVTGSVFGVSLNSSSAYVEGLTKMGASTRDAIEVLNLMAGSSNLSASQIDLVGKAAVDMERYGGVAIADTVKAFDSLAKDPVKALSDLAIKTGQVSPATMELVRSLEAQGRTAEAAGVAVKALSAQMGGATAKMQADLHPLTLAWISFKHSVSEAWTGFGNSINRAIGANPALEKMQNDLASAEKSSAFLQKIPGMEGVSGALREKVQTLKEALVRSQKLGEYEIQAAQSYKKAETEKLKIDEVRARFSDTYKKKQAQDELDRSKQYLTSIEVAKRQKEIDEIGKGKPSSEAAKQKSYELNVQEKINDAYNQMAGTLRELNPLEKALLDIRDDPRYKGAPERKKKEIEEEIRLKLQLIQPELDALEIKKRQAEELKEQIKFEKELLKLSQAQSLHGKEYEKTLLTINQAEKRGAFTAEQAAIERAKNLARNSDSEKYFKKEKEGSKKVGEELSFSEEDLRLRQMESLRTERTNALARIEFETKKSLALAYSEFYLKETEVLNSLEGQQQADRTTSLYEEYQRRRALILGEAQLKQTLLSEEVQRQKNFDDLVKKGFTSMGDALVDFAVTGKSSFGDMIKSMLIEFAKLEMRMQMMKLYEAGAAKGGGSFMSFLTGLLPMAKGGAFDGGTQKFANGGAFTNKIVTKPTMFNLGEMGEAGAEAIMPLTRINGKLGVASTGASSVSNVQVVVNNFSGQSVEKKESVDSRGNRKIEVTIGEMTAGEMSRSGSSVQSSVGNTFGLRPQLLAR